MVTFAMSVFGPDADRMGVRKAFLPIRSFIQEILAAHSSGKGASGFFSRLTPNQYGRATKAAERRLKGNPALATAETERVAEAPPGGSHHENFKCLSEVLACLFHLQRSGGWWGETRSLARFPHKNWGRGWHHRISDGQDERPDQAAAGDLRALQLERTST